MLPDKATRDEIFNKVKWFMKGERPDLKSMWTEFKSELLTLPSILEIWLPGFLIILGLSISIINRWLGNLLVLNLMAFICIPLLLISTLLGLIIDHVKAIRNTKNYIIDDSMRCAESKK